MLLVIDTRHCLKFRPGIMKAPGVGMHVMDPTGRAAISRRLLAALPVTGFAFSGLRLAILAILGRKTPGLNIGVTVGLGLVLVALAHPRIQARKISLLRRAVGVPGARRRAAVSR